MTVVAYCESSVQYVSPDMASLASELYKIQFRPGLRSGPRWCLRRLDSNTPPLRISGYATVGHRATGRCRYNVGIRN